jgi:hypothetical protein
LFDRATAGAIFTNVESEDGYNRALGVDAQYRFWGSSEFKAWYTNVWDNDPTRSDPAGHTSLRIQNYLYAAGAGFTSVGNNYAPALGFVRRLGFRSYTADARYSPTVEISSLPHVRRVQVSGSGEWVTGQDGKRQSSDWEFRSQAEFNERDVVGVYYQNQYEFLANPFDIRPEARVTSGEYNFYTVGVHGGTDSSRRLYGNAELSTGSFFDGTRSDLSLSLGFRQSRHLQWEGSINHSIVDLPISNGEFDATTWSLSILSALNRKLFAKSLIQYDNFSRTLRANIRINWIHTPGSDLFLVYNTSHYFAQDNDQLFDPQRDVVVNSQVAILKLTYLIAF